MGWRWRWVPLGQGKTMPLLSHLEQDQEEEEARTGIPGDRRTPTGGERRGDRRGIIKGQQGGGSVHTQPHHLWVSPCSCGTGSRSRTPLSPWANGVCDPLPSLPGMTETSADGNTWLSLTCGSRLFISKNLRADC